MYRKLVRNFKSEFEFQLAFLEVLTIEGLIDLKPKQIRTLAALCLFSKGHRAITDTVKHKAREFNGDSPSSFSNSLKSLYDSPSNIINDDLIDEFCFVPDNFKGYAIVFVKDFNGNQIKNEDTQTTDEKGMGNNEGLLQSDQRSSNQTRNLSGQNETFGDF